MPTTLSRSLKDDASAAISRVAKVMRQADFDLTSYDGFIKGTEFGAVAIPVQPDTSSLIEAAIWRCRCGGVGVSMAQVDAATCVKMKVRFR
jgi:hypothetical protein